MLQLCVILLLITDTVTSTHHEEDEQDYCQISKNHTMCLFQFDDHSENCVHIENGDLETSEIVAILHRHNTIRNAIAQGDELRGLPGPQPAARNMLEMGWDKELALIARRWALQCKLFETDIIRDVARFNVWQNVNVLILNRLEKNATSFMRILAHVKAWHDQVEHFDAAKVGLVKLETDKDYSAYLGLASARINLIGCARCIYSAAHYATRALDNFTIQPEENLEVLVCNYGPVDRTVPETLYEIGQPGFCLNGSVTSSEYGSLCATKTVREIGSTGDRGVREEYVEPVAAEETSLANLIESRTYFRELFLILCLVV